MIYLLSLFILMSVATGLRYLLYGEFHISQLGVLALFLVGALIAKRIDLWQRNRDKQFSGGEAGLQTRLADRLTTEEKQLYDGTKRIAFYKRFYMKRWHIWVADLMNRPGRWFLNLRFTYGDRQFEYIEKHPTDIKKNQEWTLREAGVVIGKVQTDFTLENTRKLQEVLLLNYKDTVYRIASSTISSKVEVTCNERKVASSKRNGLSKIVFDISEDMDQALIVSGLLLFNYHYRG